MPGGTAHTAGGEKVDGEGGPSYIDAVRSLGPEYYMNFHKRPCVRDSQLQGLAAGFAGGSLAAIIGSTFAKPTYIIHDTTMLAEGLELTIRCRACPNRVQLGGRDVVRCQRSLVPSVPVLPIQGEGRNQAGAGADGEEAREYRGEERSEAEAEGGVREAGGAEEGRGGEEEDLGVLVSEESQVLVSDGTGGDGGLDWRLVQVQVQVQARGGGASKISVRLGKVRLFVLYRTYLYRGGESGGLCMIYGQHELSKN